MCDLRVWSGPELSDGVLQPTAEGITFPADQFETLVAAVRAVLAGASAMSTVDSIVVRGEFDPTRFSTGLAEAERELQQFIQRTGAVGAPVPVDVKVNGLADAQAEISRSPSRPAA